MGSTTTTRHLSMSNVRPSASGKTKIWDVDNLTTLETLGRIRWHGPWRKYVFETYAPMIMDASCATQITDFLAAAMRDWSTSRA